MFLLSKALAVPTKTLGSAEILRERSTRWTNALGYITASTWLVVWGILACVFCRSCLSECHPVVALLRPAMNSGLYVAGWAVN